MATTDRGDADSVEARIENILAHGKGELMDCSQNLVRGIGRSFGGNNDHSEEVLSAEIEGTFFHGYAAAPSADGSNRLILSLDLTKAACSPFQDSNAHLFPSRGALRETKTCSCTFLLTLEAQLVWLQASTPEEVLAWIKVIKSVSTQDSYHNTLQRQRSGLRLDSMNNLEELGTGDDGVGGEEGGRADREGEEEVAPYGGSGGGGGHSEDVGMFIEEVDGGYLSESAGSSKSGDDQDSKNKKKKKKILQLSEDDLYRKSRSAPMLRDMAEQKFNWKAFSGFKSEADVYAELAELYDDEVYAAQAQIGGARRRTSLQNSQPCCEWWGCVF